MRRTAMDLLAAYERGERDFRHWRLVGADLRDADLHGADLSEAKLTGADLAGANLSEARFERANLEGADLSGADLTRAYLVNANLREANLAGANLMDADVGDANFDGAELTGADLSGTRWESMLPPGAITVAEVPPESVLSAEDEELPAAWAEMPTEWPDEEERRDEEEWLAEEDVEEQEAVEEWTAGMVRLQPEAEWPEREEEPIGNEVQPPLKHAEEAEEESRYGI